MRQRWIVFLAALAGTGVLAAGVTLAVDRALATRGPAPDLSTVPAGTLRSAGFTLAPPALPPYCGAVDVAASRHWVSGGAAGCPISRAEAIEFASGGGATAREALLATVSSSRASGVGSDRLTWLVVVRQSGLMMPLIACANPIGGPAAPQPCPTPGAIRFPTSIVFVDAHTGRAIEVLPVGQMGPLLPGKILPQPMPMPLPTVTTPTVIGKPAPIGSPVR